ncbi:TenA family protein [Pseudoxanthobacter sp.]|uniref:TenA family protein n=1 Tax=Pseudoxanthobacter sp. TaxID=1925742 RepID=UPI002FE1625F
MTIDFSRGLFGRLREAAGPVWTDYVGHPFVRQLGAGTLPEASFRRFLTQDYLFLIHFARAYGLSVYKSGSLSELRAAAGGLQAILDEIPLHVGYCAGWGISEEEMAAEPEAPETITYTRFVIDTGHAGDLLDLTVALMPCVAGYAEIGQRLIGDPATVLEGNPYGAWIRNYESVAYEDSVNAALDKLEELGRRRGAEARFEDLARIFTRASALEAAFWQMGLNAAPEAK